MTFAELLESCSDPSSPNWERAWSEFMRRYKTFVYRKVTQRCAEFKVPRLRRQLSESVNDIVSMVFFRLYQNQCHALRSFRERNREPAFFSWLATISSNETYRYIQNSFAVFIDDVELEEVRTYLKSLELEDRWELYEGVVGELRASFKNKRLLERDINIFQLYVWADFPSAVISSHPCLRKIGPRVVDNIVSRIRKHLRGRGDF